MFPLYFKTKRNAVLSDSLKQIVPTPNKKAIIMYTNLKRTTCKH